MQLTRLNITGRFKILARKKLGKVWYWVYWSDGWGFNWEFVKKYETFERAKAYCEIEFDKMATPD